MKTQAEQALKMLSMHPLYTDVGTYIATVEKLTDPEVIDAAALQAAQTVQNESSLRGIILAFLKNRNMSEDGVVTLLERVSFYGHTASVLASGDIPLTAKKALYRIYPSDTRDIFINDPEVIPQADARELAKNSQTAALAYLNTYSIEGDSELEEALVALVAPNYGYRGTDHGIKADRILNHILAVTQNTSLLRKYSLLASVLENPNVTEAIIAQHVLETNHSFTRTNTAATLNHSLNQVAQTSELARNFIEKVLSQPGVPMKDGAAPADVVEQLKNEKTRKRNQDRRKWTGRYQADVAGAEAELYLYQDNHANLIARLNSAQQKVAAGTGSLAKVTLIEATLDSLELHRKMWAAKEYLRTHS